MVNSGLQATKGSTRTTVPTLSAEKNDRIAALFISAPAKSHALLRRLKSKICLPPLNPNNGEQHEKCCAYSYRSGQQRHMNRHQTGLAQRR